MRSAKLRALLLPSILASTALGAAGCASMPPTAPVLNALQCNTLIPDSLRQPVAPAPLPDQTAAAGDLWDALDAQTAALDKANGHTADVVKIADNCQAQQQRVSAALAPRPWWRALLFWETN